MQTALMVVLFVLAALGVRQLARVTRLRPASRPQEEDADYALGGRVRIKRRGGKVQAVAMHYPDLGGGYYANSDWPAKARSRTYYDPRRGALSFDQLTREQQNEAIEKEVRS